MNQFLLNTALFVLAFLAVSYTPRAKRMAGAMAAIVHQTAFAVLVLDLYVFSLVDTIRESGLLYGVSFSMIPLAVGSIVLCGMRDPGR
ncbi:hypothetical protein F2S72_09590 [Pseudomonas syringae pv. actinidiae]|nr:hypothetical protein [Pseudomonas syringae pv. actinidiae]